MEKILMFVVVLAIACGTEMIGIGMAIALFTLMTLKALRVLILEQWE